MRVAFIETLMELAAKDGRVCLLTGDLGFTVLERFAQAYPRRFFNVGVAEADMVGLATGLALDGWVPYLYSIAAFASMRPYEQIRNGPVLHRLPVRIIGIGGGFAYGHAGATHYALEDLSLMRTQPGLTVIAPADPAQARSALLEAHGLEGPVYFQIGKGGDAPLPELNGRFSLGSVETLGSGRQALLLTTGKIAVEVAGLAKAIGNVTVGIVAALNPPPARALKDILKGFDRVLSIEEHYGQGGLGSLAAEIIASEGRGVAFHSIHVRDFQPGISGSRDFMLKRAGLDREGLTAQIRAFLEKQNP
jgi:transketolase